MTKRIMVQGTMSGAGKSLLVAALCRIFRQDGMRVAPFKSQNMALNSCVTKEGLEIGRAQALQAAAAGIEPDVRMNPILLKPSSDTGSQLIVNGRVRGQYDAAAYFQMKKTLIPDILAAFHSLAAENDVIVIEGAGSPAEINLREDDIVNMGLAQLVDAPVLLAGDIDRGGVFAQLYGTTALLKEKERARIAGLIINKFRGDVSLLDSGLQMLEDLTGIPVLGVVPYLQVDLDDEDSLTDRFCRSMQNKVLDAAVIRLPHISNFTDFTPLAIHPQISVRYVLRPDDLKDPDLIILPGTKSTMQDLIWLRENGLEALIRRKAGEGTPVLGICGGYQMLGRRLSDPQGVEAGGEMTGLDLLPCDTEFEPSKTLKKTRLQIEEGPLEGAYAEGYEIHMGRTLRFGGEAFGRRADGAGGSSRTAVSDEEGTRFGHVMGTYLHGLFDAGSVTDALAAWLLERKGMTPQESHSLHYRDYQEQQLDLLAEGVRGALDMDAIRRILDRQE